MQFKIPVIYCGTGMRHNAAVYVAATRQHVGKTSTCLGLLQGLLRRCQHVGFLKPVGQQSVLVQDELRVDKDVAVAKGIFGLPHCDYEYMSPIVVPAGFTRQYLDGKIDQKAQLKKIRKCFAHISSNNNFTLVEGTGHTGVGSILDLNNARIAAELEIDMILIANGGIGSAFDDLALNYQMCKAHNVRVRGVILNKVIPAKVDMIQEYFSKALIQWDIPLIGIVPSLSSIACFSMLDFEELFRAELLSGQDLRLQRYHCVELVTCGLRNFGDQLSLEKSNRTLFVTHASRKDIILSFLSHTQSLGKYDKQSVITGLIITGIPSKDPLDADTISTLQESQVPVLYAPYATAEAMEMIRNYTAKYSVKDRDRVLECAKHYEDHLRFDMILDASPN